MEPIIDLGVQMGLSNDEALKIVSQTVSIKN